MTTRLPDIAGRGAGRGTKRAFAATATAVAGAHKQTRGAEKSSAAATLMGATAPPAAMQQQTAAAGTEEMAVSETQRLCVEILASGNTRSFVDFFLLTHQLASSPPSSPPQAATTDSAEKRRAAEPTEQQRSGRPMYRESSRMFGAPRDDAEATKERLRFVKEHISESERATRQGDLRGAASALAMIAEHFEKYSSSSSSSSSDLQALRVAVQFHEKALAIATSVGDVQLEVSAHRNLGACAERIGDTATAIAHYERCHELAADLPTGSAQQLVAMRHLIVVYQKHAEQLERDGDRSAAAEFYTKCLKSAEGAEDRAAAGAAHYRLGLCYTELGRHAESITHLQAYLELCRATHDEIGEGLACSALAAVHRSEQDSERSVKFLEENLALAQRTGQQDAEAQACCNLGVLCNRRGDFVRAAEYFERYFELARQLGDARMVDSARIHLGVARGSIRLQEFAAAAVQCPTPADVLALIQTTFLSA